MFFAENADNDVNNNEDDDDVDVVLFLFPEICAKVLPLGIIWAVAR